MDSASIADKADVAISALEFGGSLGKLLWISVRDQQRLSAAEANRYIQLAERVRTQVDLGRATSELIGANFNLVAASATAVAVADPEPLTKGVAGVAAWGAKKTGEAIGRAVLDQAQDQARSILAQGLQESGISQNELHTMTPNELRSRVADLQVGGVKLQDALRDVPGAIDMLQAQSIDLATNIGVEALARSQAIGTDLSAVKTAIVQTKADLDEYRTIVTNHIIGVQDGLNQLREDTVALNSSVNVIKNKVGGNTAAIQGLAAISYAGWTTSQKLQAVRSGLIPGLSGEAKNAVVANLQAQQKLENTFQSLQSAAQDFGNLAQIARNVGLPPDVVIGLQGAQVVAGSVAKFATGDVLGAVAGLTSLVGLGGPDAETQHYRAMMSYLKSAFAEVNVKLDRVIELQGKTLEAIADLAKVQDAFRTEVLGQLHRIETAVFQNRELLQGLVLAQWDDCHAMVYGPAALNGKPLVRDREQLIGIIADGDLPQSAAGCYRMLTRFLDAKLKPAAWAGTIIAADLFPTDKVLGNPFLQRALLSYQAQKGSAFETARAFFAQATAAADSTHPGLANKPASLVTRLAQPVADAAGARALAAASGKADVRSRLEAFRCTDHGVISPALRDLLCVGILPADQLPPDPGQLQALLFTANAPLIGPQAYWLMDIGLVLSTLADFARRGGDGSFRFDDALDISEFSTNGPSPTVMASIQQRKGQDLLLRLRLLAEVLVLQQALAYGDMTAELVEQALYDAQSRSLIDDPSKCGTSDVTCPQRRTLAVLAMKANPILARNVVMLALRHAIEDALGGADQANVVLHHQTYYGLALADYASPRTCDGDHSTRQKLVHLFPNWKFEYRATSTERQNGFNDCPAEIVGDLDKPTATAAAGSGPSISLGDFYVTLPSAASLAQGEFEQSDSLRLALAYRDRLSQAIVDRSVGSTLKALVTDSGGDAKAVRLTMFGLLNDAWGWQPSRTAP